MTSENYRQLLNNEFEAKEMTKDDFDNTLMYFAMLYHKEQLALSGVVGQSEQLFCYRCQAWTEHKVETDKSYRCTMCGNMKAK